MPATRQFDVDRALDAAMQRFWTSGYRGTSFAELVAAMGVNRASLYATFGDKQSLFLAALRRYDRACRRELLADLEAELPPKAAIRAVFDRWIARARTETGRRGCLLANTTAELTGDASEVSALIADTQRDTEKWFRRMVRRGQRDGDIPAELDAAAAARRLLGALIGMLVLMRSRPEPALLKGIATEATAMLDGR